MKKIFKNLLLTLLFLINAPLFKINAYTYDPLNGLNFTEEFKNIQPAIKDNKCDEIWKLLIGSFIVLNPPVWNHLHETKAIDFKTKNYLNEDYAFCANSGPTIFRKTYPDDQLFLQKTVMVFCKSDFLEKQYKKNINFVNLENCFINEIRKNKFVKPSNFNTKFLKNPNLSFKRYIQKYDLYHFFPHQQIIDFLSQDIGYVKEIHIVLDGKEKSFYYDHGREIKREESNSTGAPDHIYILFAIDGVKYNITESFGLSKKTVPNIENLFKMIGLTPPQTTTTFSFNFLYKGKLGTFEIGIEMQKNKAKTNWLDPIITHRFFNPIQVQNGFCNKHYRWNCTHGKHPTYEYDSYIHNKALPFPDQTNIEGDLKPIATTVETILSN